MHKRLSEQQAREYRQYLRGCTDAQVQGCYDKEKYHGHSQEVALVEADAARRGLDLDRGSWRTYRMEG